MIGRLTVLHCFRSYEELVVTMQGLETLMRESPHVSLILLAGLYYMCMCVCVCVGGDCVWWLVYGCVGLCVGVGVCGCVCGYVWVYVYWCGCGYECFVCIYVCGTHTVGCVCVSFLILSIVYI